MCGKADAKKEKNKLARWQEYRRLRRGPNRASAGSYRRLCLYVHGGSAEVCSEMDAGSCFMSLAGGYGKTKERREDTSRQPVAVSLSQWEGGRGRRGGRSFFACGFVSHAGKVFCVRKLPDLRCFPGSCTNWKGTGLRVPN